MFGTIAALGAFALTVAAGLAGFNLSRTFVRTRLRFVDAIRSPLAPWIAGLGAFLVAWPVAALPLVSVGTAITFGIACGLGTASGARAVARGEIVSRPLLR
ncbi:MAG: hypothetical protein NW201_08050 [Gemmatimonadales bacterium]|nr:hypothetical protein [Gemmatimonadales bacterium]